MKAIIIGGGIAGLSTALALQIAGLDYEIYEAAPELKPVGAGISLSINAMRVYRSLGIADAILNAGAEPRVLQSTDEHLRKIATTDARRYKKQYGVGFVLIHRARLQAVLLHALDATRVHTGKRLVHVHEADDQVSVTFEDGSIATGDFLIGADGIHSATRHAIFPDSRLRYAGQTCWRGIVKFELPTGDRDRMFEAWGGALRFGCTPVGHGEVYWFAVKTAIANGNDTDPRLNMWLADHFERFAAPVCDLIRATDPSNIIRNDLYDLAPMPTWSSGRCLLIGDAAHATTPNMGQGGCQAAEDAYYLGKMLAEGHEIPALFAAFEQKRRPKVDWIVQQSRRIGQVAHWRYARGLGNWLMRRAPIQMMDKQLARVFHIEE
jgi:2-polyprenyl-6-methoxyphenol hydroxylase-like FAD-dependent oxidoreductase